MALLNYLRYCIKKPKLMKEYTLFISIIVLLLACSCQNKTVVLFDGTTFNGWEGNTEVFRIDEEAIVGGSLSESLDKTYYLSTEKQYSNFRLKLKVMILDQDSSANAGISFRASRVPNSEHVAAYQADLGYGKAEGMANFSGHTPKDMKRRYPLWGTLVDECRADHFRYPRPDLFPIIFLDVPDRELVEKTVNFQDWNDIEILADGPHIKIWLNGVLTADFVETADVDKRGYICLQAHSGEPFEVHYKDIIIEELN